ncbi:hypothetical protein N9839_02080 [Flavobacteriaceae bacterium]|nr:hypothetical protein [Flavobacteriaceae bacterium]
MYTIVKKISTTLLSFIVLFSSMSFAIDEHYCGNNLMDVSYFGDADNCGSEEVTMNSSSSSVKQNNCCKDETTLLESSIFNKEKFINLQHIDAEVLFFKANSYLGTYKDIAIEIEYYTNFSPPDIAQDIQVLHQAFLI